MKTKWRRQGSSISTESMADIAFLLLIFFLLTTTLFLDQGVLVRLPPYDESAVVSKPRLSRNILTVKINGKDELLVENQQISIDRLREQAKEFISNPSGREDLAQTPGKAVISLQNDRSTSYAAYVTVYNELKAAYRELWEEAAQSRYRQPYIRLSMEQQRSIRQDIPLVISEAEPFEIKQ